MSEYRKYPKGNTRQIIDFATVASQVGKTGFYCLDKGILLLARQLVAERGLWRTSFSMGYQSDGYLVPDVDQFEPIQSAIGDWLEGASVDMTNELLDGLEDIALAIRQTSCCPGSGGGSGGSGGSAAPESGFVDDGVNYPDGYPDQPTYQDEKCQVAEKIRQDLIADLTWIRDGSLVSLTATGLALALLTPIPFDEILLLVGFIVSLFAQSILVATAQVVIDKLTTEANDFRCALVVAETVSMAKTDAINVLSLSLIEEQLLQGMLTTDSINRLFEHISVGDFGVTCSCVCAGFPQFFTGGSGDLSPGTKTLSSTQHANGNHYIGFGLAFTRSITIDSISGYTDLAGNNWRGSSDACSAGGGPWDVLNQELPPTFPYNADLGQFEAGSTTPWTMDITIGGLA